MRPRAIGSIAFFAALIGALVLIRAGAGGPAPTPAMFDPALSLAEAEAAASGSGRIVMVLATADWCGPCQSLKRGALADDAVEAWAAANATPVILDLTAPGPQAQADAQRLGIGPIPTIILLRDGQEIARHVGVTSTGRLLRWLETATGQ